MERRARMLSAWSKIRNHSWRSKTESTKNVCCLNLPSQNRHKAVYCTNTTVDSYRQRSTGARWLLHHAHLV